MGGFVEWDLETLQFWYAHRLEQIAALEEELRGVIKGRQDFFMENIDLTMEVAALKFRLEQAPDEAFWEGASAMKRALQGGSREQLKAYLEKTGWKVAESLHVALLPSRDDFESEGEWVDAVHNAGYHGCSADGEDGYCKDGWWNYNDGTPDHKCCHCFGTGWALREEDWE